MGCYDRVAVSGQSVGQRREIGAANKASEKNRASQRNAFLRVPVSGYLCPVRVRIVRFRVHDKCAATVR